MTHWIIVFLVGQLLLSCNVKHQSTDMFYSDSGDSSYLRFPLVKPYYVHRLDGNSPWVMPLFELWAPFPNDTYSYWNVRDVKKISLQSGVILAYSPYVDEKANESIKKTYFHWFVVVPEKKIEIGFSNETEFLEYIQKLGIQQPAWQYPLDVFQEFEQTGCLDWVPDCN